MARVIQVSEFASSLERKLVRQQNGLWLEVIDAELAEVRAVLNALVRHRLSTGECWCPSRIGEHGDWRTPGTMYSGATITEIGWGWGLTLSQALKRFVG